MGITHPEGTARSHLSQPRDSGYRLVDGVYITITTRVYKSLITMQSEAVWSDDNLWRERNSFERFVRQVFSVGSSTDSCVLGRPGDSERTPSSPRAH